MNNSLLQDDLILSPKRKKSYSKLRERIQNRRSLPKPSEHPVALGKQHSPSPKRVEEKIWQQMPSIVRDFLDNQASVMNGSKRRRISDDIIESYCRIRR